MKISAAIITLNEQRNIRRCLKSIKSIADEIVVVDSFSVDETENICKEYGVKFITHGFEGYVRQKNFAVSQTSFPYVLSIDADEAVDSDLCREILNIKENTADEDLFDAYNFNRMTNYCGERWIKHSSWYPDVATRLFRKDKACFEGGLIHEKLVLQQGSKVKHLHGNLLHYSYYTTEEHIAQLNKFTSLGAKEYASKRKNISLCGVIFKSFWTFFRNYFLKLGVLDGYSGLKVCLISAFATFIKYVKVKEIIRNNSRITD